VKLQLSLHQIATIITASNACDSSEMIESIAFDSRKISNPSATLFFALQGEFRDGHSFIKDAYSKGIRNFVIREKIIETDFPDAIFLQVVDTLKSLQQLATFHRNQFKIPLVAITGSVGKTTVKEWIYHLISDQFQVVRSPKSYNSQLGVALSLLEMNENHQIALIEAGISKPTEMHSLAEMIRPTIGIFTALGSAYTSNFDSPAHQLAEQLSLFNTCQQTFVPSSIQLDETQKVSLHAEFVTQDFAATLLASSPYQDKASRENLRMALAVAMHLGITEANLYAKIKTLPRLALRMETFDGIQGNLIINDSYNLDLDALNQSLEYQISIANGRKRVAIIATEMLSEEKKDALKKTIEKYQLDGLYLVDQPTEIPLQEIQHSVVLIKGTRVSQSQKIAAKLQLKKHKTRVEIDFSAVKHNLIYFRSLTQ
jgi:UDP-N-acetylmuramyl pentapeptide synthase